MPVATLGQRQMKHQKDDYLSKIKGKVCFGVGQQNIIQDLRSCCLGTTWGEKLDYIIALSQALTKHPDKIIMC